MTLGDDRAARRCAGTAAEQELRDFFDRLLGRRQAYPSQRRAKQRFEPLEREREVRAALVAGDRMNLIDDHRSHVRQHFSPGLGGQQNVQRLGRRHDDMRRAAPHTGTLGRRGVSRSHERADLDVGQSRGAQFVADPRERTVEIALDVVRQRLQRRDIEHSRLVGQPAREALAHQGVNGGEKGGQGLAGAGRRGNQDMAGAMQRFPGTQLCGRRRGEAAPKPGRDRGMKGGERISRGWLCRGWLRDPRLHQKPRVSWPPEPAGGRNSDVTRL